MHESTFYRDHVTCNCPSNKLILCHHSLCVAKNSQLLKLHIEHNKKSSRRSKPSKSDHVVPEKIAPGDFSKGGTGIETRGNKAMVKQVHRVPRPRASLTRSEIYIITTDPSQHVFSLKNLRQKIVVTAERNFLVARCLFFLARLIVIPAGNLYYIIPTISLQKLFCQS